MQDDEDEDSEGGDDQDGEDPEDGEEDEELDQEHSGNQVVQYCSILKGFVVAP